MGGRAPDAARRFVEAWAVWGHAREHEASIGLSLLPDLTRMADARDMVPKTNAVMNLI